MRSVLMIFGLLISSCYSQPTGSCKQTSQCSCQSNIDQIDLTPLASKSSTPAFHKVRGESGTRYFSWNPCTPFSQGKYQDAAVCMRGENESADTLLGTQGSALFMEDGHDGLNLEYSHNDRKVTIRLRCSDFVEYLWIDDDDATIDNHFTMTLMSRHACRTKLPLVASDPVSNHTVTAPTPGTPPSVITVTQGPSDLDTVTLLLFIEVLATILILVVVSTTLLAFLNRKLRLNRMRMSPPGYEQVAMNDDYMIKL